MSLKVTQTFSIWSYRLCIQWLGVELRFLFWVSVVCMNIDLAWNSSSLLKVVCMSSHWNPSSLFYVPWRRTKAPYCECLWSVWKVAWRGTQAPYSECPRCDLSWNLNSLLWMAVVCMNSDLAWNPSSILGLPLVCMNSNLSWNPRSLLWVPLVCMTSDLVWNPSSLLWVPVVCMNSDWRGTQVLYCECLWSVWTVIGVEPKFSIVSARGLYEKWLLRGTQAPYCECPWSVWKVIWRVVQAPYWECLRLD